jgi:ATP/maltotriose-dependent transcriptional regulator MalT
LVHGGLVDGSGWQQVYRLLRRDGFNVSIAQNPTLSLEDDAEVTRRVLQRQDGPTVLVGHSYGGAVITEEETGRLLAGAGIALPGHVVAVLHQRTEGWAAGLRLAVLSLAGHPDPGRFVAEFSGSDRTVAEYLMAEMLERQPPQVQRLLLRTSVLDRVNGELAGLLAGGTGPERILLDLEDANAFVTSLDPGRTWFRYHRMFSGLLRLELRRTMPADVPDLHRLAARWRHSPTR